MKMCAVALALVGNAVANVPACPWTPITGRLQLTCAVSATASSESVNERAIANNYLLVAFISAMF